jgi:hypothetical protein
MNPTNSPDTHTDATDTGTPTRVPTWFRVVAVIAVLWNLLGCMTFAAEIFLQEEMLKTMSPEIQEWSRSIPGWIYFVYFLAVGSGTLASIGLVLRKPWCTPLYVISLVSVVIQMGYTMVLAKGHEVLGTADMIMPLVVIVLAAALLWLSKLARTNGWIDASMAARQECR